MVELSQVAVLGIVVLYLLLVLGVGFVASRRTGRSREEFFMASRTFGTVVLFFAIFATHMTAVALIGAPSLGHELGVGGYGLIVVHTAFLFPFLILTVGVRIWSVGDRFGHITPSQILNHRLDSDYLGLLLMALFTFWTVPYVLVGIQGSGIVFEGLTNGFVPYWLGSLVVTVVVALYLGTGGMRSTGWTNTFQGVIFMAFLLVIGVVTPLRLGGPTAATQSVLATAATHVNRAGIELFEPRQWFSVGIIFPLASLMFPHMFIRFMTGRSTATLKRSAVIYPVALFLVWMPAILLGFWSLGHLGMLDNPDFALPMLVLEVYPLWVVGFVLAAILAALMSSIDAQVLTLSTLFTEDVLDEFVDVSERREVLAGRLFVVAILGVAYVAAQITSETIVDVFIFAAAGFGLLFVPVVAVLYWEGASEHGVGAALTAGFVGLWAFELGFVPETVTLGFHEFLPLLLLQFPVLVGVSAITSRPPEDRIQTYRQLFSGLL